MGSNDLHIAALVGGQPSLAENASIPQAKPVSPVLPASEAPAVFPSDSQQDRVSLSGTLPPQPRQLETQSNGNVQPAAFTPLAQEITFPPGESTADVFTTSTFPPAATEAGQNSVSGVATTSASKSGSANAIATFSARTGEAKSPVAAAAANAAVSASPTGVSSTAPARQTLQQLDRELQRLGIDPQSLSLIRRGGMLNSINEPAALRQIVQNVRSAENPAQPTATAGVAKPEQNTASSNSQPASSANTNAQNQSAATAQQNAAAVAQFQKLQDSLAPRGVQQALPASVPDSTAVPQGQLLNVSA